MPRCVANLPTLEQLRGRAEKMRSSSSPTTAPTSDAAMSPPNSDETAAVPLELRDPWRRRR